MQEEVLKFPPCYDLRVIPDQQMVSGNLLRLENGRLSTCPLLEVRDYINVYVTNERGEALVVEYSPEGKAWSSWQTLGRELQGREDPLTAVQELLLHRAGYRAGSWLYLGTFVLEKAEYLGAGHFFCARQAVKVGEPEPQKSSLKWVPRHEIKQGLLDGRIAAVNHAMAVTLALLLSENGAS